MAEGLTNEERAWLEYLAWTRGAIPSQYVLTERRAWERLQRALHPIVADLDGLQPADADADAKGQWQHWSEGWDE